MEVLQTLANSCSTGHIASCLTLSILWIVLIVGLTNVLCTFFSSRSITIEEEKEKK